MTTLLGLDLGTSGATALLLGPDLEVRARASRPIQTQHPQPGWVEQDPWAVLEAVRAAAGEVLAAVPGTPLVGFANPGESVLAWDVRGGEPLTPVLVWSDTRSAALCDQWHANGRAADVARLSGLRLDPYFCAARMAWLLAHDARVQAARQKGTLRLCTLDAWITFQLGGGHRTDHSTASRTQLYDMARGEWHPELLTLFGVPPEALPEIGPSLAAHGQLRLGGSELPWTAAALDQVAALAGNGCLEPGEAKVTYGTGAFVLAQAGDRYPAECGLIRSVGLSSASGRSFVLDGGVYSAGSALTWLASLGVLPDMGELDPLARAAGPSGVRFLPALSGLGAPWWRSEARGVLSGLSGASGRAEIVRAVLDGIAARVTDVLEVMAQALPDLRDVRADGGLTRSSVLLQRQADLSGLTILRSLEPEATALGMALLAGLGAGALTRADLRARTQACERVLPGLPEPERLRERQAWTAWVERAAGLG